MKASVLTLLLSSFLFTAKAANYTATTSGNWTASATWGGAGVPGLGDYATIPSGITVTVTGTPDNNGADEFSNPATIIVAGTLDFAGTSGATAGIIFLNPLALTVASGGTIQDFEAEGQFNLVETSTVTVDRGGTFVFNQSLAAPYISTEIYDQTYEPVGSPAADPNEPYFLGADNVYYDGSLSSIGGPFTMTVQPSATDNHLVFVESAAPYVVTQTSIVGITSAQLSGTANAEGLATTVFFQYSRSPTLASGVTTIAALPSSLTASFGSAFVDYTANGLTENTTYYYRVIATNAQGTSQGSIQSFTTASPPVLTPATGSYSYTIGGTPTVFAPTISVTDAVSATLSSASIYISGGYAAGDILLFTAQNGISASYSGGILTLTGTATLTQYEAALQSITFETTAASTATRTISMTVTDGVNNNPGSIAVTASITVAAPTPTVSSIATATASPTNAGSVQYTVTFSSPVAGLTAADFSLPVTGSVSGAAISGISGSGTTYAITVNTGTGDGTIQLNMVNATGITPAVTSLPFPGPIYTIDKTPPVITISSPSVSYANGSTTVTYTLTYSDANLNTSRNLNAEVVFDNPNVTGSAFVSAVSSGPIVGNTQTITIQGGGDGTIGFTAPAGSSMDNAGNSSAAVVSPTFTEDNTAPVVTFSAPSVSSTVNGPVSYTATWTDANLNASSISAPPNNVIVNETGTATYGSVGTTGSGNTRTIEIGSISGAGAISIGLPSGTASDLAGNVAGAAGPSASFTVGDAAVITFNALTATYGSADLDPATSTNSGAPITYTSDNTGVATIVGGKIHIVGAGAANITASQAAAGSYMAATDVVQQLTVSPAPLTIMANNQSGIYGAGLPTFTASYSGFVNGDEAASLTFPPAFTIPTTPAGPVGRYPITLTGAVDPNYTITYVSGELDVTPAPLTITVASKSSIYGAPPSTFTAAYNGFVNGDDVISLTVLPTFTTTATAASPVGGAYPITASGAIDPNYTITYVPGLLSISPAPLTITADNQNSIYGSGLPTFTASYSGFVNGDGPSSLGALPTFTTTATAASPVGPYPITASGAASGNYTISYAPGTLTIGQASLTITADNQSALYGAAIPTLTASYSGFVNGDGLSSVTKQPTLTTTATPGSSVGPYPITASGAVSGNYIISYAPGTLNIGQAPLMITADNQSALYGAAIPTLTASYSGFVNGDGPSNLATPPTFTTTATTGSPVGPYPITASGAASGNYTISYAPGTLNIGQALLTITADNQSTLYGAAIPTLTASYSGFVNGDGPSNLATPPTFTTTATTGSPVGPYPITASGAASGNYTISYAPGTLNIGQALLTITADNQSTLYGAAIPTLTASYSGFVNGDGPSSLTTQPTLSTMGTPGSPVGPYPITASGAAGNNYTISYAPGTLTIGQASLTITANNQSSIYGGALPTLTASYSGFVNGDGPSSLTTQPTLSTTGTPGSPVGPYPITASGAAGNNYTISYAPGTLTIGQASLTITADNQSSIYGGAIPALTASYSGFVNGDGPSSLTTQPTLSTTGMPGSPVGPYPITASGAADNNYTISYAPGTLTIGQASLTITANNQSSIYGGAIPAFTASYSGFVNGDGPGSLTTQPALSTTGTSASPVGPYPITASGAVDNNYTISYAPGTLTIGQAPLTITANNQSSIYGAPLPTLTAGYSGFVNGDGPGSLTTQPALSTTGTSVSPVGPYPITASGAVDNNYTISYAPGTLTVGQASLTITANNQSSVYGGVIPALTASYSGFVNGDGPGSLTTQPALTTTGTSASPVGPYPITASGAVDNNYSITYPPGTLTVGQAPLTITADNQSRYFGEPNPTFTVTYSGFVNGDNVSSLTTLPIASTTATTTSAPGPYAITPGGAAASNYAITYQNGTLTILASLPNVITFGALPSKTYGDADFVIDASASSGLPVSFTSGDNSVATVTQDGSGNWVVHIASAGQVTITATQAGAPPYVAATNVDEVLTVNKADQGIIFPAPAPTGMLGQTEMLAATASSGLPVIYTVTPQTLAAVSGNSLTFTGTGTVTITATQPGDNNYNAAASMSDTVQILNSTSFNSGIGVFPNPAHGTLHIRFSQDYVLTKYVFFTLQGRIVRGEDLVAGGNNDIQVNVSDLAPGYYLLRVVCIRNNELVYPVFKVLIF